MVGESKVSANLAGKGQERDTDEHMGQQLIVGPMGLKTCGTLTFENHKAKMLTTLRFMGVLPMDVSNIQVNPIMVPDTQTGKMAGAVGTEMLATRTNDARLAIGPMFINRFGASEHGALPKGASECMKSLCILSADEENTDNWIGDG